MIDYKLIRIHAYPCSPLLGKLIERSEDE